MKASNGDEIVVSTLLDRLIKQRLPSLLSMKEKVDNGIKLDHFELDYLERSIGDAQKAIHVVNKVSDYHSIASQVIELYKEIIEKVVRLENEE